MGSDTLFSKIVRKEIPADVIFENENIMAFRDISPQAPVHILIIPKKPIVSLAEASTEDKILLGEIMLTIAQIAEEQGLSSKGYRVVTNIGKDGGQSVFHLHFHLLGGRALGWPPG